MPWNNQNGSGPWGGSGNDNGGDKSPWGKKAPSSGGNGGGNGPDFDDILRKGQDSLKQMGGGLIFLIAIFLAFVFWLFQCTYFVQPNEQAIELRFGVPKTATLGEGLHFHFWPVETYLKVPLTERAITIGGTLGQTQQGEGLMLSGDQSIVYVNFSVYYRITNPSQYLFNVNQQEGTVNQVAESAMREIVGRRPIDDVLRDKREEVADDVKKVIQSTTDKYQLGITISRVSISDAAPPSKVAAAFNSVQQAEQARKRLIEEGNKVRFTKMGEANGQASRIREIAKGEKARIVEEATGRALRFETIAKEAAVAPEATRYRLYMETMGNVLSGSNKLIMDQKGSNAVPYLPLNGLIQSQTSKTDPSAVKATTTVTGGQ